MIRRLLAGTFWRLSRWRHRSVPLPPGGAGILIGAPHTSNWDFILMLAVAADLGIDVRWLGKRQLFRRPFGRLMRALGGIPVDRSHPGGLVAELVGRVKSGEKFYLLITPEGTRRRGTYWKSGFYRIAHETGLPVALGFVDRDRMTVGVGPSLTMTGDLTADMDRVRDFYADKKGVRPERGTSPRLRDEDAAPEPADAEPAAAPTDGPDAAGPAPAAPAGDPPPAGPR
ncbi:1-acyl-sn-glycerol-3-phosphate acyltransferase [Georgenia sp. TF02-10]|uniref:1-acyl-sn-glycerol-3-phosphate acyltransferase n=1 Tax=Georgenia sp. TF02-10 TaxID=2917725 RepID=UPI00352CC3AB